MSSRDARSSTRRLNALRAQLEEAKMIEEEVMRENRALKDEMVRTAAELERINKKKEALLECPVCMRSFNGADQVPILLKCSHTVCGSCMVELVHMAWTKLEQKTDQVDINCPSCRCKNSNLPHPLNPWLLRKNKDVLEFFRATQ
uniref:RING-type domain-containing protein n=1 Tax=Caenorhabditis tropicalis TaxID=1561998 RepID=A0A1I7TRN6_9PELO